MDSACLFCISIVSVGRSLLFVGCGVKMKKLPNGAIASEKLVPYPIRLAEKDLKTLRANGIDVPESVRGFIRDLAKQIRGEK